MLTIDRLELVCTVERDHPAPESVARRVHAVADRHLGAALGRTLARTMLPADERVRFVRRLDVHLDVDVGLDDAAIGDAIATAIATGLSAGVDGTDSVVEFVDPVDQLARLLVDLAAGVAWDRWYHRSAFAGLVHLRSSIAIRTIAEHQPLRFAAATERLTMRSLAAVCEAVHPADAARILAVLPASRADDDAAVDDVVAEIVGEWPRRRRDVLLVVLAARRRSATTVAGVVAAMEQLDDASKRSTVAEAGAAAPVGASATTPSLPIEAVATASAAARRAVTDGPPAQRTQFGGVFVLLAYLAEAARAAVVTTAADRLAVAAAIAGPAARADPIVAAVLADPAGVAPLVDVDASAHTPATLAWLEAVLAVGPVELGVHVVRCGGTRMAVVVDEPTGHWVALRPGTGTAPLRPLLAEHPAGTRRAPHRTVGATLRFLQPGEAVHLVTAANVLRRFATSLPGFALAGAAHLWREAVDAPATVTETSSGWHVAVDRTPLAEIMRMCGHGDRMIPLPWQPGRSVRVVIAP